MTVPTSAIRRVVVSADGVEVVTAEAPRPRPGEVLVRSVVTGVCGSDTHAAHGRHPFVRLPYHPGHEVVGVVLEAGEGVDPALAGARVTLFPLPPCGACKQCRRGVENLCERLGFFGCGYEQGGMAERFTVPAHRLFRVPDAMDDRTAALIEPLSTPVHAVRLAGDVRDRTVVILGAGTIGLLLLAVVRAHGARRVVVTDPLPAKRALAAAHGADAVLDARSEHLVADARAALGESADVVFDCVSVQGTVEQAIALADKGGTVVVVGVPARDVTVPLPVVQDHQIRLQGSATYLPEDFAESVELLLAGRVDVDAVVTAAFPLEQAADAFAASAGGGHVKVLVVVDPDGGVSA